MKKKTKNKKRKIRYGRILLVLVIFCLLVYLLIQLLDFPIKNIYIYNNSILTDQEIIDLAGISDYPSILSISNNKMEKNLKKNIYIKKAQVVKKKLKEVHIYIDENYPLFYDLNTKEVILKDGRKTSEFKNCPTLVNYVTDTVYKDFSDAMLKINKNILDRISEIKYDPNDVDEERFLITMNDGNYVYLTVMHFEKINSYVEILKNFENQKGILFLDSGEYFQVYE